MELKLREQGKPIRGLCNEFPMRPDFMVQIIVPYDMTSTEALRLATFVLALGLPDSASSEPK